TTTLMAGHTVAQVGARVIPSAAGAAYSCRFGRQASPPESLAAEGTLEPSTVPRDVVVPLERLEPATRYYIQWSIESPSGRSALALDSLRTQPPNRPPETIVSPAVVDTVDAGIRVSFAWSGYDPDGTTVGFDVSAGPWGSEPEWKRTASPETLLTVPPHTGLLVRVRAVDDDGACDPSPAFVQVPVAR
ncbi:MAG: hypothetical protein QUU85_03595, partial [Candidatus Eisenbacteria bacterium]|nr:hypothetical protein [Candidatus Eisenbacteria bacterium]